MKKILGKLISAALSAAMLFSVVPLSQITANAAPVQAVTAGETSGTSGDCVWSLDENGVFTVSGNGAMADGDVYYSPWERADIKKLIIEPGVTYVGKYLFYGCVNMEEVLIPDSVTSLGEGSFSYCSGLSEITIPDGIEELPSYVFTGCSGITEVSIPESVNLIGYWAFGDCENLESVFIPQNVTAIYSAFGNCQKLKSFKVDSRNPVYDTRNNCNALIDSETNTIIEGFNCSVIPNGVERLGYYSFNNCRELTSVNIPESLTDIGSYTFLGCYNLSRITVDVNNPVYDSRNNCNAVIETSTNKLVLGSNSTVIPDAVTCLGESSMSHCAGITDFIIPSGVTSLESGVFGDCLELRSITIPDSVTSIGYNQFEDCSKLSEIKVDPNNPVYDSRGNCNAIIETSTNKLLFGCNSTIIPDGTESIGSGAFKYKSGLTSVKIPDSVTDIEYAAFLKCTGLKEVVLPEGLSAIKDNVFTDCNELKTINIPDSVKSIGTYAFSNCYELSCNIFPSKIETVRYGAFQNCRKIESVKIPKTLNAISDNIFYGCDNLKRIWVDPDNPVLDSRNNCNAVINTQNNCLLFGCKSTYIPDDITSINSNAFNGCRNLKNINIPKSVTSVGYYAFSDCDNLTDVFYSGNESEWNQITFSLDYYTNASTNTSLDSATIHFNSQMNKAGDVNLDGKADINDATQIQYYLAYFRSFNDEQLELADVDYSGVVDIKDVTRLQKNLADLY